MENERIPDARISASSQSNSAANGRLHFKRVRRRAGAWIPQRICKNNTGQWLQVDFGSLTTITGIATQGSENRTQWVQNYTLSYSDDGNNFTSYQRDKVIVEEIKNIYILRFP